MKIFITLFLYWCFNMFSQQVCSILYLYTWYQLENQVFVLIVP